MVEGIRVLTQDLKTQSFILVAPFLCWPSHHLAELALDGNTVLVVPWVVPELLYGREGVVGPVGSSHCMSASRPTDSVFEMKVWLHLLLVWLRASRRAAPVDSISYFGQLLSGSFENLLMGASVK